MVSSAIWEKHARVSFSKMLCVFEKFLSVRFSQISRETILLRDNDLYMEMIERQDNQHLVIMNALISGRFNQTIRYCIKIYILVGICVNQIRLL